MMQLLARILCTVVVLGASTARADWHSGKVNDVYFSYDGLLTTITLVGFTKTGCTCYSSWPDRFCMNRTRATYKEEVAALLAAKAAGQTVYVNLDEVTCSILAFGVQ